MLSHDQLVKYLKGAAVAVDDNTALEAISLYPLWEAGTPVTAGERKVYMGRLYKCRLDHTTQADWTPDFTPNMWTVIDVSHAGTINDPIPAAAGMEYIKGKYYIEAGTVYLMNRQGMTDGESIVLQYLPSNLVGQYFEVVNDV